MGMLFDETSAQAWADFSGDFNRIHFDPDFCRRAGLDGVVVHGMLALLRVKQTVAREFARNKVAPAWHQFKALFRAPLPQNREVDIGLQGRPEGVRFHVADGSTDYFTGAYTLIDAPNECGSAPSQCFRIDSVALQHKANCFFKTFPFVTEPWIWVDAIAFAEILRSLDTATGKEANRQAVMQMSHRVAFDPAKINRMFPPNLSVSPLCYSMKRTDSWARQGERLSLVELNVLDERSAPVMQVEIGLISKNVLL